jgi:long-chain acyl-CoA synthetase
MTNLAQNLAVTAAAHPTRTAVRHDELVLTYADLDDLSARVAGMLRESGVEPGDRVGLMLPNVAAFPLLYYGVLRAGAAVVPMNPLLKTREIEHYLGDSGARLALVWQTGAAQAEAGAAAVGARTVTADAGTVAEAARWAPLPGVAERADDDTAVILYTSGTTGTPKGAQLTHANLRANAEVSAGLFGLTPQDVLMGCLPLFHAFGQTCALNAAVAVGAALTVVPRFDAATALKVIERDHSTIFEGVPTMYVGMLAQGAGTADTSTLRICVSGGAALPVEILRGFEQEFGASILEGYGLSETSPVATFNRPDWRKPGSIGLPVDGVELKLVDAQDRVAAPDEVGEITIRGHNVMKGYWQRPEATAEAIRDGWFHTGDLARVDVDGFYYIVDRKKELIIRGGYNIYPREIEEVLYEHPAVLHAAVVGIPHRIHGEEVGAAVALRDGVSATPEGLRDYVKARVAAYKYPRHVWVTDAMPLGPTGKILKRAIEIPADVRAQASS